MPSINSRTGVQLYAPLCLAHGCECFTTPIMRIPFQGQYWGVANHNNIDTLHYKSTGNETCVKSTQLEVRIQRQFRQWLQLVHCTNLQLCPSISMISVQEFRS